MTELQIAHRRIGSSEPVFVIGEIGVNHDGSVSRALELVEIAARCGADAVKLQIFRADALMHRSAVFAEYQVDNCEEADAIAMLRRYQLPPLELCRVVQAIRDKGMIPLATPFSPDDVETIAALDLPAIKIASPDIVNRVLLERASRCGKPMLVSTGAATMDEVAQAARWISGWNVPFALLHCISSYPTPTVEANLAWISELAQIAPAGYSDHTTELLGGAFGVAAGAVIVEKHLTYDRAATGPDHRASADPAQFLEYVRAIRLAEAMRGQPGKWVLPIERDVRKVSRQSLVLLRDLRRGEALSPDVLTVQRPGTGIPAAQVRVAIGRTALRAISAGTLLQWEMLSDAA